MRSIFLMLLCVVMLSCNENEVEVNQPVMSVGVQVMQTSLKSAGLYDRGSADVYIAGLDFVVKNKTYNVTDVEKSFEFVKHGTTGGKSMIIEGITPGKNEFICNSIAEYSPLNAEYELMRIPEVETTDNVYLRADGSQITETADNYTDRAYHYSNHLDVLHPLYMPFTDTKNNFLELETTPNLHFNLKANCYRLNVVLECVDGYMAVMSMYSNKGGSPMIAEILASGEKASCFVLNDQNIRKGNDFSVLIDIYDADGRFLGTKYKDIKGIKNGTKATRVYRYNGTDLEECSITATYQPILEDNSGGGL